MKRNNYTFENLSEAVRASTSVVQVLAFFNVPLSGGMHAHVSGRIKHFGIDTSHFPGSAHGRGRSMPKKDHSQILRLRSENENRCKTHMLRRAILQTGVEEKCEACGCGSEWMGKNLTLEIDHIDGNPRNDTLDNLRFLCPNCHSVTPTYKNKRRG